MANWLDRARRELRNPGWDSTAKTDETSISSVLAVPNTGESGIFGAGSDDTPASEAQARPGSRSQDVLWFGEYTEKLHHEGFDDLGEGVTAKNALTNVDHFEDASKTAQTMMANDGVCDAVREAAEERAAILEYDAGLSRPKADEVAIAAEAFYRHLFGPGEQQNCCFAPAGRFCQEGKRLISVYFAAAWEADGRKSRRH